MHRILVRILETYLENVAINGRDILKWILKKQGVDVARDPRDRLL
jgi:hypothetical protein